MASRRKPVAVRGRHAPARRNPQAARGGTVPGTSPAARRGTAVRPVGSHAMVITPPDGGRPLAFDPATGNVTYVAQPRQPRGRRARQAARSYSWRWRRQLAPAAIMGGLWCTGAGIHEVRGGPVAATVAIPLAVLIGVVFGWRFMRKLAARVYVPLCAMIAGGTILMLAWAGPLHQAAGTAVALWTGAALPWWWRNRHVASAARFPEPEDEAEESPDDVDDQAPEGDWDEFVACQGGPLPGSRLTGRHDVLGGWSADIVLIRGRQTATDAANAAEKIASAFGADMASVVIERHLTGRADMARITILTSNPLHNVQFWTAPTLDPATGVIQIGPYATGGMASFRPFAPAGDGHPGGAMHSLICGCPGSGKSQFLLQLALEYMLSGLITVWAIDPQFGQSMPELVDCADWAALGVEEAMAMLRAARFVLYARSQHMGQVLKMRAFTPTPQFPLLRLIIDEATRLFKDATYGKEAIAIVEEIAQMGRKVGIGMDLITQHPDLGQLGNSEVLRSMLQSGNIVCFRTAGGMTAQLAFQGALPVRPDRIPQQFPNGTGTGGLCYLLSATARESVARTLMVTDAERAITEAARHMAPLDQVSARAAGAAYAGRRRGGDGSSTSVAMAAALPGLPPVPPPLAPSVYLPDAAAQPVPGRAAADSERDDAGESPAYLSRGVSADDAVLVALQRAGRPLMVGDVVLAAEKVAEEWGRSQPYKMRTISGALARLRLAGKVAQDGEKSPYYLPPQPEQAPRALSALEREVFELLPEAVQIVIATQHATTAMLQRKFRIGTEACQGLMTAMETLKIVGPSKGDIVARDVLFPATALDQVLDHTRDLAAATLSGAPA